MTSELAARRRIPAKVLIAAMVAVAGLLSAAALTGVYARAGDERLMVSAAADRSGASTLDGLVLPAAVGHVFVDAAKQGGRIVRVEFAINGKALRSEHLAPYDLGGTAEDGTAKRLDTSQVTPGTHTISAVVVRRGGRDRTLQATFTLAGLESPTAGVPLTPTATPAKPTGRPKALPKPVPTSLPKPTEPASAPTSDPSRGLTWRPPALKNPIEVTITSNDSSIKLDDNKDYRLRLGGGSVNVGTGGVSITGGRNVVLIGGEIKAAGSGRSLMLKNQTGVLHIEGVHISGRGLKEGINLDQRAGGTVQLQNIRIDPINGSLRGHHADIIQTWAGPKVLRIDRFEGTSNYQCMMIGPRQFGNLRQFTFDFRNIVTRGNCAYYVTNGHNIDGRSSNVLNVGSKKNVLRDAIDVKNVKSAASPLTGQPGAGYKSPGYVG